MAVRSWDELRLLRLARRVFTVVKKKKNYVSFPLSQKVVLRGSTIFVRFNVPPLFIVPPPREREHVPCSCTQGSVPPFLDW